MRFNPKKINLDQPGLSKVLGSLEADVMELLWADGALRVREVTDRLCNRKQYSFNTIMTVMNRLVEKGLLSKTEVGGSYAYAPVVSRDVFLADVGRSVFATLLADAATFRLSAFAEALAECSDEDIRRLRDIIDGRKL